MALGIVAIALSANRWGVALLGWIAPVPFLVASRRIHGCRNWLIFLGVTCAAGLLATAKIITDPVPPMLSLLFGIPAGIAIWLTIYATEKIRRSKGEKVALYAFASIVTAYDWFGYSVASQGIWETMPASQLDNLPFLQLVSLGGLGVVSFIMAWFAATLAALIGSGERRRIYPHLLAATAIVTAAHAWGSWRLDGLPATKTVTVGGVVTDVGLRGGFPAREALDRNVEELFARSALAASRGAALIAWNEVATLIERGEEASLEERAARFARERGVDFIMAYGVILSREPLLFDNKYVWYGPDGREIETYRKHHPVPGEPSLRGTDPIKVNARPWGRAAGAICYDYDNPDIVRAHSSGGAGLVVLPSSDWRGIDPHHTLMTRVSAIQGGFSVVRPVRWATSMAFDQYGRIRACMPARELNDKILMATVPVEPVPTLYRLFGEWPPLVCGVFLLFLTAGSVRSLVRARRGGA
ncbi:MAG TPA: nitrilase-related carbon-nitrogen hydrolase [Geobacteraceae bacterium]